jgi:hypothetical protein
VRVERRYCAKSVSLSEFADKHGLTMVLLEQHPRKLDAGEPRFICYFKDTVVRSHRTLHNRVGKGNTEQATFKDYMAKIRDNILVINYSTDNPADVQVPYLSFIGPV